MRTATTILLAALLSWLTASGRLAVAQDAPKEVHEVMPAPRAEAYADLQH